jgi:hypothetical protein
MPSASTSSGNPYDNDAVERDLIDPDDGMRVSYSLEASLIVIHSNARRPR